MKIIEALKELPLIEKKINKNIALINENAAFVDNGSMDLPFGTATEQQQEVKAFTQSTNNLVQRYARIRRVLALTNASVSVQFLGVSRTISEWIAYREKGFDFQVRALQALSDAQANAKINSVPFDPDKGIKVVRFYNEKTKLTELAKVEELRGQLDAQLEMVNATTDLVEEI